MLISIDTECTGLDFFHSTRPYFISICDENFEQTLIEWDVNPLDRMPYVDQEDISLVQNIIDEATEIVFHNAKYDITALKTVGINWDKSRWAKTHDTILAGHLLASNHSHGLTEMCIEYLGENIEELEIDLETATKKARTYCKNHLPYWRIAEDGLKDMPSTKKGGKNSKIWKADMWLPKALYQYQNQVPKKEPLNPRKKVKVNPFQGYDTVLKDYAKKDSEVTVRLWNTLLQEMKSRELMEIYQERRKLLPVAFGMEGRGLTYSTKRMQELEQRYKVGSNKCGEYMLGIAEEYQYDLQLPQGASPNDSLRDFCFDYLKLPQIQAKKAKSEKPSLAKEIIDQYVAQLSPQHPGYEFVKQLANKRSQDTALSYMKGYRRFSLPTDDLIFHILHPRLNLTGTDTLRMSSNSPNGQNISKKELFNLRYLFGPATGREWWSLDAKNLELRIPAYESNETDLIWIFEHPNDGPYYGSYHLVVFDVLYPKLFKLHGKEVKDLFESTFYQWVKNGNFGVIYGAQEAKADATYHVLGAYQLVAKRFPKIAALNQRMIAHAKKYGYVETIPDRVVNPLRGYPILCSRTFDGGILPTTPLNYHIQSTAMQWMARAMINCEDQFEEWRSIDTSFSGFISLQVHDELLFDLEKVGDPLKNAKTSNLPIVRVLQNCMECVGERIGVPTPVTVEYHSDNWSKGVAV